MPVAVTDKRRAAKLFKALASEYPDVDCALHYESPVQLLVATILSAQCTDEQVNKVTPALFEKFPDAESLAKARISSLEKAVKSTGFFRNKAKNIKACCTKLVEDFGGQVPEKMEDLVGLPGVGRKTANVVLGTAFRIASGVVVDTHVKRLSNRMGLSAQSDPVRIERDLMEKLPKQEWIDFSHRMIRHGRRVCNARKPKCEECVVEKWCPRIGVKQTANNG
ncbi:MAG: endonuclease III [Pirellulales bacterium]|nr:endonuclease III [Pirellulales bacterium]